MAESVVLVSGAAGGIGGATARHLAASGSRVVATDRDAAGLARLADQAEAFGSGDPEGYRQPLLENYPQGARARFLRPEEVAHLIFYLAQPAAAGITGANVAIDFGLSAGV